MITSSRPTQCAPDNHIHTQQQSLTYHRTVLIFVTSLVNKCTGDIRTWLDREEMATSTSCWSRTCQTQCILDCVYRVNCHRVAEHTNHDDDNHTNNLLNITMEMINSSASNTNTIVFTSPCLVTTDFIFNKINMWVINRLYLISN